ncbi:MAG: hypothetical protein WEE89_04905 [Gemmatimonadota bacterium]
MSTGQLESTLKGKLVEAEAARALNVSGCSSISLFLPSLMVQLAAFDIDENEVRVCAVDAQGNARTGPRGPVSADEVVGQMRLLYPKHFRG